MLFMLHKLRYIKLLLHCQETVVIGIVIMQLPQRNFNDILFLSCLVCFIPALFLFDMHFINNNNNHAMKQDAATA